MIEQNGFTLLVEIIRDFSVNKFHCSVIYSAAITMIFHLALIPSLHEALLSQVIIELLYEKINDNALYNIVGSYGNTAKNLLTV